MICFAACTRTAVLTRASLSFALHSFLCAVKLLRTAGITFPQDPLLSSAVGDRDKTGYTRLFAKLAKFINDACNCEVQIEFRGDTITLGEYVRTCNTHDRYAKGLELAAATVKSIDAHCSAKSKKRVSCTFPSVVMSGTIALMLECNRNNGVAMITRMLIIALI